MPKAQNKYNTTKQTRGDFDVVIIGGGLAGFSMVAALCQLPLSIAVIEAAELPLGQSPSFDDRALALSYGSLQILKTIGVFKKQGISTKQTPIKSIHVSDRGHFGFLRMHHDDVELDYLGAVISARDLGSALFDVVENTENYTAKITRFVPAKVSSISHLKEGASLEIVDVKSNKLQFSVTAQLVILADGGRSPLNQSLGIAVQKKTYQQVGILANLRASMPHQQTAYERFTKSGPIALLPLRKNDFKLVWTVPPQDEGEILAMSDAEFLHAIQFAFGDRVGEFQRVGKRLSYSMQESKTTQMTMGRVALIGNSAHTLHPIAGQGFNLGLRDVACLAELISNAVQAGKTLYDADLIEEYADERREDIVRTAKFTDSLVRMFSNEILPLAAFRSLGLLVIDHSPKLKKDIMYKMMGLSGKQGKLLRGLALVSDSGLTTVAAPASAN